MLADHVADEEILYRCVRPNYYVRLADGTSRPSSQAFTDPEFLISVDRAKLCNHDPRYTQREATDFICSLVTEQVRDIRTVRTPHTVRVDPEPVNENPAHAIIHAEPQFASKNAFRKLQEALALIATWEIGPAD